MSYLAPICVWDDRAAIKGNSDVLEKNAFGIIVASRLWGSDTSVVVSSCANALRNDLQRALNEYETCIELNQTLTIVNRGLSLDLVGMPTLPRRLSRRWR